MNPEVSFAETEIGLFGRSEKHVLFFGNKNSEFKRVSEFFPDIEFRRIKQTHSDQIVEATDEIREADAHFTAKKKVGLLISTADCLPVLIACRLSGHVASVHAGWKGVANQIVPKTLRQFRDRGSTCESLQIWVGPHIQQYSFEVDRDVLDLLKSAAHGLVEDRYVIQQDQKYLVNLNEIVKAQIESVFKVMPPMQFVDVDTKPNLKFCSYRREKGNAERNLSFIALS